jgi:hypothetical protein
VSRTDTRLWPWSAKAALLAAPAVLVILLVGYGVLGVAWKWPDAKYQGWVLLAIAVYSGVPVLLLIIQALASLGGTIEGPGGVKLSFSDASDQVARAVQTTTLAENLGTPSSPAEQKSGMASILRALRRARQTDVTVVDLREGDTWWESRLFILIAAAARRGRPAAIAFVSTTNLRPGAFIGWGEPQRLLDQYLSVEQALVPAYRVACASAARWALGTPAGDPRTVTFPWAPLKTSPGPVRVPQYPASETLQWTGEDPPDPDFAFELYLQAACDAPAISAVSQRYVGRARLQEFFDPVLVTDQVDRTASDEEWVRFLTGRTHRFFALTDAGAFRSLVSRDALVAALLGRLAPISVTGAGNPRGAKSAPTSGPASPPTSKAAGAAGNSPVKPG